MCAQPEEVAHCTFRGSWALLFGVIGAGIGFIFGSAGASVTLAAFMIQVGMIGAAIERILYYRKAKGADK